MVDDTIAIYGFFSIVLEFLRQPVRGGLPALIVGSWCEGIDVPDAKIGPAGK